MKPGRTALRWGVAAWFLLFVVWLVAALISSKTMNPGPMVSPPGYEAPKFEGVGAVIPGSFLRADALWYLKISEQGYRDAGTFAFLPLFPLLIRGLSPILGTAVAAIVVANLACIAGLTALFALVEAIADTSSAKVATFGLALFPTAFFLVAPYAEPVFLASSAGALLATVRRRYWIGAFLGALAALARPFGLLLAIPLALAARDGKLSRWIPAAGPLAGAAGWVAWVWIRTGNPMDALSVQSIWQRSPDWPFHTTYSTVKGLIDVRTSSLFPYFLYDALGMLALVVLITGTAIAMRNRVGLGLALYGGAVLIIALSFPFPPRPLLSLPRFILALSPLFVAYRLIPRVARIPFAAVSGAGLLWAAAQFVASRPIF